MEICSIFSKFNAYKLLKCSVNTVGIQEGKGEDLLPSDIFKAQKIRKNQLPIKPIIEGRFQ